MKLFELSEQNMVGVYTDDSYDEEALAGMLLVFNCSKATLKNHIKEMLKENAEADDENYADVANNINGAIALQKFLKKKNIKSVTIESFSDNGLSIVDIAESMGKIK